MNSSLRVINRSFSIEMVNALTQMLTVKCSENHLEGLAQFIRFNNLGFKSIFSKQAFLVTPHKVRVETAVMESTHGKIYWELRDGIVELYPMGRFGDLRFTLTLEHLCEILMRETELKRWDDFRIASMGLDGRVIYFYSHLMFDDHITITDRETFYIELSEGMGGNWICEEHFCTEEMRAMLAEQQNTGPSYYLSNDGQSVLTRKLDSVMKQFKTVADIKAHFHVS